MLLSVGILSDYAYAQAQTSVKGSTSYFAYLENFNIKFSSSCPCQSISSLTVHVPLWFVLVVLVFFDLSKLFIVRFPSI